MKHLDIYCTYCDSLAVVKNNIIKMQCICDDDRRFINVIDLNDNEDYLYKMFNDDYEYVDVK